MEYTETDDERNARIHAGLDEARKTRRQVRLELENGDRLVCDPNGLVLRVGRFVPPVTQRDLA